MKLTSKDYESKNEVDEILEDLSAITLEDLLEELNKQYNEMQENGS